MKTYLSIRKFLPLYFLLFIFFTKAQISDSSRTIDQPKESVVYPKLQIKGLFQARYLVGMKDNVDVNGLHHLDHSGTDNNFMIKYMRVQVRAQISKRTVSGRPSTSCLSLIEFLALSQRKEYDKARRGTAFG